MTQRFTFLLVGEFAQISTKVRNPEHFDNGNKDATCSIQGELPQAKLRHARFSCVLHRITDPQLKLFFSQKLHLCNVVDCTILLFFLNFQTLSLFRSGGKSDYILQNDLGQRLLAIQSLINWLICVLSSKPFTQQDHRNDKYQETLHFEAAAIFDYIWYILDVLFLLPSRPNVDDINYVQLYTVLHLYSIVYCKISMLIVLLSTHSYTLYVQVHRLGLGPW